MSADIQVGDVVVCVDTGACPHCSVDGDTRVSLGGVYRVSAVTPPCYEGDTCGLGFAGIPLPSHEAWCEHGFRKLRAPDTEISRQIKACKPIPHREGV